MDTLDEQAAVQSELCFERIEKAVDDLNHTIAGYIEQYKEDQALIQKLKAQINKDNTNSSIPTSQRPNHRTPPNNREKTRRKPRGQKGHKGHKRNKLPPTEIYHIQAPDDIVNSPDYYKTGRTIVKQLIRVSLKLEVIQYEADEYRHHITRQKVHAAFPEGIINDVEYDAGISAMICLLHSQKDNNY